MTSPTSQASSTSPASGTAAEYSLGFYARQPVFDRKGAVWAFSLYFRDGLEAAVPPKASQAGAHQADTTHSVLAAILGEGRGQRLVIKFPAQSLIYELPLMFPPEALVVEVHEDLAATPKPWTPCADSSPGATWWL